MTNAEARFNNSLRPRKPEGSLGRTAQDVHLDSHTAPELWCCCWWWWSLLYSAVLRSWADSLRSHMLLHEWLTFLNILRKWCTYSHLKPSRDQEQEGGAGLSQLLFINSCFWDASLWLLCATVETAISKVHKLLRTGGVPTSLTLLSRSGGGWRSLRFLRVGARGRAIHLCPVPPFPRP